MADSIRLEKIALQLGTKRFSFDIAMTDGAITAVTGPSGSGKSTLLNLIAGFEIPESGRILIAGEDVTHAHPSKRPISLVFQDNNLFAHLDLVTNIGLGVDPSLKLSREDRSRISQSLERVGLSGFETRKPGTLSGGERQRAAFARVLVRKRPVLLMDEPFAALDPELRASMASLLLDLHRETGNTVVIVSHDRAEVQKLADVVVAVDDGTIVNSAANTAIPYAR
ncbi:MULTISPECIES: ATP-binding cassette domain-containing protein [unclassified Rhizobium]|uniref:thiamine ABC transporter ATP-binding protein n=1 Tax=unclassified Rhizobium TaxID=2613769 RepID=UPI001AE95391|nr:MULTISPECIES: ATP-binding cassette domain-containing protein [unclassified Rhizobium]MBP2462673.1 thiamine transport system ATP-binding protein [Rhizobium sp. PvP014]MBP2530067.1 thiamine transport system ATP-binding protein [Rhizobium sp. PvP099]